MRGSQALEVPHRPESQFHAPSLLSIAKLEEGGVVERIRVYFKPP